MDETGGISILNQSPPSLLGGNIKSLDHIGVGASRIFRRGGSAGAGVDKVVWKTEIGGDGQGVFENSGE